MKTSWIICLSLIVYCLSVDCEEDETTNPTGASDCMNREHDNDKYCCYIKGVMRDKYELRNVDGCYEIEKKKVDNNAITDYLAKYKSYGSKFSLDCYSPYYKLGIIISMLLSVLIY